MLIQWPLNAQMVLDSVYEAIMLDFIMPNYDDTLFGDVDRNDDEEELNTEVVKLLQAKNLDVNDNGLNMGLFGLLLVGLVLSLILYYLLRQLAKRFMII